MRAASSSSRDAGLRSSSDEEPNSPANASTSPSKIDDEDEIIESGELALFIHLDHEGIDYYYMDDSQVRMSPFLRGLWCNKGMDRYGSLSREQRESVDIYRNRLAKIEGDTEVDFVVSTTPGAKPVFHWLSTGDASRMVPDESGEILRFFGIPFLENDYPINVWHLQMKELYLRRRGRPSTSCPKVSVATALEFMDAMKNRDYEGQKFSKMNHEPFDVSPALKFARDKGIAPKLKIGGILDLSRFGGKLCVAGGSVSALFTGRDFDDYDLFFVGLCEGMPEGNEKDRAVLERAKEIAITVLTTMMASNATLKRVGACETCWSFSFGWNEGKDCKIQFVLRNYSCVDEILLGFDVDACSVAYDGTEFYVSERASNAFAHRTNFLDLTRASPTYEYRLFKYCTRGFDIAVPNKDQYKSNDCVEAVLKYVQKHKKATIKMNSEGDALVYVEEISRRRGTHRTRNGFLTRRYFNDITIKNQSTFRGYPFLWFLYAGFARFMSRNYIWKAMSDYKKIEGRGQLINVEANGTRSYVGRQGIWISTSSQINRLENPRGFFNEMINRGGLEDSYLMSYEPSRQLTSSFRNIVIEDPELWYLGLNVRVTRIECKEDAESTFYF